MIPRRPAFLLPLLALLGCGPDPRPPADCPACWPAGQGWRLEVEARIGADHGPAAFGRVVGLALDDGGRAWVADAQNHRVVVFDGAGRHVRSIGRRGGGPDEFADIAGIARGPGGSIWVVDAGNQRYAVYDTAGVLTATHPRRSGVLPVPWPGGFDHQGRLYDVVRSLPGTGDVVVRYGPDLQPLDTLTLPRFDAEVFEVRTVAQGRRATLQMSVPFSGQQIWGVDPAGSVWVAQTGRYRVDFLAPAGPAGKPLEHAVDPIRVSRATRREVLEQYTAFERQGGRVDLGRIPRDYPPLQSVFVDGERTVWAIPSLQPGRSAFDVFDAAGGHRGRVAAPVPVVALPSPAVRGGRMIALTRDDAGVESVVVMRVVRPGR